VFQFRKGVDTVYRNKIKMSGTIRCQSTLIPVRIDSVTDDKAIRIVDTLLFDPTCWPITLYQPLFKSVEQNVVEIAHNIISDAEVQVSLLMAPCYVMFYFSY